MEYVLAQWQVFKSQVISLANDTAIALPLILVFTLALAYFTVYLYLRFFSCLELRGNKRHKRENKNTVDKNKPDAGTTFVEERGQVVRRSLRQRKKDDKIQVTPQNQKIKVEERESEDEKGSRGSASQVQTEQKIQSEQRVENSRAKSSRLSKSTSKLV